MSCAACSKRCTEGNEAMHELSIAASIVEIACRHAKGRRVTRIQVKAGHLRQVVPTALSFSFELVAQLGL